MNEDETFVWALRNLYGIGIPRDTTKARKLLELCESPSAQACLAGILSDCGEEHKAFALYLKSAKAGYENAILETAKRFEDGIGVPESTKLATEWYERLPDHPVAQLRLAFIYEDQNEEEKCVSYLTKAAQSGNSLAQLKLGLLKADNDWILKSAANGNHFAQNKLGHILQSTYWFEQAASQGCAQSHYELGLFHDLEQDESASYECFRVAAELDHPGAQNNVACLLEKRGSSESEEWFLKSAQNGNRTGQFNFAKLCQEEDKLEEAVQWLQKSAAQGCEDAQYELGMCYYMGRGAPSSDDFAIHYWRLAASQQHTKAEFKLGECYLYGIGTKLNQQLAMKYITQAATKKNADAQNTLGQIYWQQNRHEDAREMWMQVTEHHVAQLNLGFYHESKNDRTEAVKWFQLSAAQHNPDAISKLAKYVL